MRRNVADRAEQRRRVDDLGLLIDRELAELEETVAARRTRGFEAARAIVLSDRGRVSMDAVRRSIAAIEPDELWLLSQRSADTGYTESNPLLTTLACATLSLVARAGLALVARKARRSRPRAGRLP